METIEIMCLCALNMFAFIMGAKIGQKTAKGEEIKTPELPKLNPMSAYREHQEKKKAKEELDRREKIMRNIERYDGTEAGQEDID